MKQIAQFSKVSFEEYATSMLKINNEMPLELIKVLYDEIKLPTRSTKGSAGYDFFLPDAIKFTKDQTYIIPTGIRCKIEEGWMLMIVPRSGLGFKYRIGLDNTVGIIDSDYYNSDNEGHIFIKLTCDAKTNVDFVIKRNQAFAQGIFIEYGITIDDDVKNERNGGFGSTDNKKN